MAMGYTNAHNGGGPANIAAAISLSTAKSGCALTAAEVAGLVGHEAGEMVTIVGFGSLLSEKSALSTCRGVTGFRLGRVDGWRRVFAHPAAVFFERAIAIAATKEVASLSAEPAPAGSGFVVAAFEIPIAELAPLLAREEEFNFVRVRVHPLDLGQNGAGGGSGVVAKAETEGWMCTRSTDDDVLNRPGLREKYGRHLEPAFGTTSVWGWAEDSGILPCPVYCRHCVLATQRKGVPTAAADSFQDETFLVDRKTTLRQYLAAAGSHVMGSVVPEPLLDRYNG
jgi:hypothetical protein